MISPIKLSDLKLPPPNNRSRERSLQMVAQYRKAQFKLENRCKELGIPVPEMIC